MGRPPSENDAGTRTDVEELARLVERFSRKSGFERRCRIGEAIFSGLFEGSLDTWRTRGPGKNTSFRELARRLEGCISKSELHRAVSTHLLAADLPFVASATHLTVSHADAVEGLRRSDQEKLLLCAEREKWNVRRLRQEKSRILKAEIGRGARRVRSAAIAPENVGAICRSLEKKLDEIRAAVRSSASRDLAWLGESDRRRFVECAAEISAECDGILRRLASVRERPS